MYRHDRIMGVWTQARDAISRLFPAFFDDPSLMPPEWAALAHAREGAARAEPPPPHAFPEEPGPPSVPSGEWKARTPIAAQTPSKTVTLANDLVLGIDLGTTTCRVAVVIEGAPRLLAIASERGAAMPSIVALDHTKDRLLGPFDDLKNDHDMPFAQRVDEADILLEQVRNNFKGVWDSVEEELEFCIKMLGHTDEKDKWQ
jgi:hypothetical protein